VAKIQCRESCTTRLGVVVTRALWRTEGEAKQSMMSAEGGSAKLERSYVTGEQTHGTKRRTYGRCGEQSMFHGEREK